MSLSSFFSSFVSTVYADAPAEEEKPAEEAPAEEEAAEEEEEEEPEDVCAVPCGVRRRRTEEVSFVDHARSEGGVRPVIQVRCCYEAFPALPGEG